MDSISSQTISAFREGSNVAFKEIYMCYSGRIYDVALKILKDSMQAEEIVQECFVKVWSRRESVDVNLEIWPYLYVTAKRLCFNSLRNMRVADNYTHSLRRRDVNDVEEKVHFNELQTKMQALVETLPEKQKLAWTLSRVEGHSHQQIAIIMGISTNTVKNHISQALKTLRKKLADADYIFIPFISFFLF